MRVLRYAEACRARGVLVVPDWPGSVFAAVLRRKEEDRKVRKVMRFRPWLECPSWLKSNTFKNFPKFDFLVYKLDF